MLPNMKREEAALNDASESSHVPQLPLLRTWARVLFFRASPVELRSLDVRFLIAGLIAAWVVGVGRHWDNPKLEFWQKLGLGSVVYVFCLSLLLYLLGKPLRSMCWSYRGVLTFVSLTSPPAILYATPVEKWMPLDDAAGANTWFLVIVSIWRLALWFRFLWVYAGFSVLPLIVVGSLPIIGILVLLTVLNLEGVVVNFMAGIQESERTSNDGTYIVIMILAMLTWWLAIPLGLLYLVLLADRNSEFLITWIERKNWLNPPSD